MYIISEKHRLAYRDILKRVIISMDIENNKILKIKDWTDKAPLKLVQYTNRSWSRLTGIEFVSAFFFL